MPILIPGEYFLVLFGAALVLAFVLETVAFVQAPITATGSERPDQKILVRLAAAGGVASLAVVAVVIVADLAHPGFGLSSAGRNFTHPYTLLAFGAVFCLIALVCGAKPLQPVLLLCLTLPALVVMPLIVATGGFMDNGIAQGVAGAIIVVLFQPGNWILLFIGLGQVRLLWEPGRNSTPGVLVRLLLILFAYLYGYIY